MHLLAPMPTARRPARIALLLGGLALYGISDGLLVLAATAAIPTAKIPDSWCRSVWLS